MPPDQSILARRQIAPIGWHKTAVDEDREALLGKQRRQNPVAAAEPRDRSHQGFAIVEILPGGVYAPIAVAALTDARPLRGAGCVDWRGVHPLRDLIDQMQFPSAPLELPKSERRQ